MEIMSTVVTQDRRVEDLRHKLNGVDFGVNLSGYDRARIAQVVLAVLDAEREEIVRSLEQKAAEILAQNRNNYNSTSGTTIAQADALRSAASDIKLHRNKAPEITVRDLWKAGQPTKDWLPQ